MPPSAWASGSSSAPARDDVTGTVLGVVEPKGLVPPPEGWDRMVAEEIAYEPELPAPMSVELYDMIADPGEMRNVADEHPEVVAELSAKLDAWYASVIADMHKADIPPDAKKGDVTPFPSAGGVPLSTSFDQVRDLTGRPERTKRKGL